MKEEEHQGVRIRQVLVALDASASSRAALEAAAELAAAFKAELRGLFVEDRRLHELAEHPMTSELHFLTATVEPWDPTQLRLQLRARAEQARRALRMTAEGRKLGWSFSVTRGEVAAEILAAAQEADLVTLGRQGWHPVAGLRGGSTAGRLLIQGKRLTLIHDRGRIGSLPVVVLYDGSPTARRALDLAAAIVSEHEGPLTVVVPPKAAGDEESLRRLESWAGKAGIRVVIQRLASRRSPDIVKTLKLFRRHLLVLPGHSGILRGRTGESLLRSLSSSVLVVRS